MTKVKLQKTGQSRVWLIEDRAGPGNAPEYQSLARGGSFSWPQGERKLIRGPSDEQYDKFDVLEQISGAQGSPVLNLQFRMTRDASEILRLVRNGCPFDVQLHVGACKSPLDFNGGWEKIMVLEGGGATDYGIDDLGAFDFDQENPVQESVPVSGLDWYEILPIAGSAVAEATIIQEVIAVDICDSKTCGECGLPSNGCSVVLAVTVAAGGSPGLPAMVVYTQDGGLNLSSTHITSLPANKDPSGASCVGTNYVVISNGDESLHYAPTADILAGTETWTKVTTGFVGAKGPNAIFSLGSSFTWIVGDGGYVYFSSDITAGVDVQSAGAATVQNLNAIHGTDKLHLVAVGDSNAVLKTANGGSTWSSITGPNVGVNLNTVWMRSETEWLIGDAGGQLWYTQDGGTTWTEKAFPGSGAGNISHIEFATPTVGYMAHATAAAVGRILRTVDGGYSWYVLPEEAGLSLPANDKINDVAACADDANLVWGGGLADNASDGILIKVA